jgi:phage terminase small subunit
VPAGKKPPTWLTNTVAKAIWKKGHAELSAVSILLNRGEHAFARYCKYLADWIAVDTKLKSFAYGGSKCTDDPFPEKPKGMHWRTDM